jgi:hypothetical protein
MLPCADFFDLFANEFAGLGGGGLSLTLIAIRINLSGIFAWRMPPIASRTFDGLFLWHD